MTKYEIDPYTAAIKAWRKEKYGEEESREMDRADIFKDNGHGWVLDEEATLQRMRALEQLCRDLFRGCEWQQEAEVSQVDWDTFVEDMQERMDALGLLEGDQNG